VLRRETLGRIWAGNITVWSDPAIQQDNPALASRLTAMPIQLGIQPDTDFSITEPVKLALRAFSPEFARTMDAANNSFALLPPVLDGTATLLNTSAQKSTWLQVPN
jgi:hypothetical protein